MASRLDAAGARRPVDVCVEVGMAGGRTGCRDASTVDEVARAAADCPALRLIGVAGYEAALGHDVTPGALARVTAYLSELRSAVERLADVFETDSVVVTAGGSTYFDAVADVLTTGSAGRADRAHHHSQRLLPHPRRRALRKDVAAGVRVCCPRCRCGRRWCRDRSRIWHC